jgi:phosphoglycolate phosphatase-like HAD superfamily hydrolase
MQRLILWDVDGTLLTTGGVSAEAMRVAMGTVLGPVSERQRHSYAGKTDWQIINETFPHLDPEAVVGRLREFSATYVAELQRRHDDLLARARLLPGVIDALLALHEPMIQAPLTGNIAAVARIKIETLGLQRYLNLTIGGYGDDHYERARLVQFAIERATAHYERRFEGHDVVVVGDTPSDIRCGQAHGARTIAVATGPFSMEDLAAHQPDALLADLSDTAALLRAIAG